MRHLEWLLQLCFICYVMKIIKTHGELLSKQTIFQLQKSPAVNRDDNGDVIKNIPKICYDKAAQNETATENKYSNDNNNSSNTAEILNIFKTILQQLQSSECEQIERKEVQATHEGDIQPNEEKRRESQYEVQPFSILQQLKLDEQKQKWQQQQQQQQQNLNLRLQQQQNALKLQHIMQHLDPQSLGKADEKKKKKRKRKKRRKKKKKPTKDKKKKRKNKKQKPIKQETFLQAHPAHILFASPTQRPQHYYHENSNDHYHQHSVASTTKKPQSHQPLVPIKKIKYILRKNTIFKKKKKEYLNHLKHVLYPFVKFIAFFTILNPFTLAIFLFSLVSPVVFGFLGFIGLSFLIKPALHLLFGVKQTVNTIKRQKLQQLRKRQRLRDSRRPITIHKHYYQQKPIAPPPSHHRPYRRPQPPPPPKVAHPHSFHRLGNRHQHHRKIKLFNPLLPDVKQKLKNNPLFTPDFKGYKEPFELI